MNNEEEYTKYTATNKSSLAVRSNKITSLGIHLLDHIHCYFPELFIHFDISTHLIKGRTAIGLELVFVTYIALTIVLVVNRLCVFSDF